ncbi:uncharacterized protein LOC135493764 [Lineus longissimus]|uniref:uncharacterized protein LOC135493764 n=1 Tax=Lineus longissimus TaxID=88925 RepID=UPI002B4E9AE9
MEEIKKPHLICIEDFGSDDDDDDSGESGYVDGAGLPARVARPERSASAGSSSSLNDSNQGRLRYMNIVQFAGAGQSGNADQVDGNMVLTAPLSLKQKLSCVKSELNKKSGMLLKTQNDLIQRNSEYTMLQTNLERSKSEIDALRQKLAESEKKNRMLTSQVIDLTTDGVVVKKESSDDGSLARVCQLESELQRKTEQLENVQKERDELKEQVTEMETTLQKVEKGILAKIQKVQKPDAEIGLTPQGDASPDLWRRFCLLERELTAIKTKNESLKHKLQKKEQRSVESEKRVAEVQAELAGKDLNLQHAEANLKQHQARVKWYSEILHKKEEQLCQLLAEKKERESEKEKGSEGREDEKTEVKPAQDKDKSKIEFTLSKPNIFDILKKQFKSVPAKKKSVSAAAGSAARTEPTDVTDSGDVSKNDDEMEIFSVDSHDSDDNSKAEETSCKVVSENLVKSKIKDNSGTKSKEVVEGDVVEGAGVTHAAKLTISPSIFGAAKSVTCRTDAVGSGHAAASSDVGIFASFTNERDVSVPKTISGGTRGKEPGKDSLKNDNSSNIVQHVEPGSSTSDKVVVKAEFGTEDISSCDRVKQTESLFQPVVTNTPTMSNCLTNSFSQATCMPTIGSNRPTIGSRCVGTDNFKPMTRTFYPPRSTVGLTRSRSENYAPMSQTFYPPTSAIGINCVPDYFGPTSPLAAFSSFLPPSNVLPVPVAQSLTGLHPDPVNRTFSCPTFAELQNSSGFFGDLLPSTNPETQSDASSISRPGSFASFSDPTTGLSTPSFGELLVPNVVVKQEPVDAVDQTPDPVKPYVKEEPLDEDIINTVLGLEKDKAAEDDPFEDSLLKLKSLIAAQSLPSTPNDMDFSDDSNSGFASPALGRHVQNFLNGNDDEPAAGPSDGAYDEVDGKKKTGGEEKTKGNESRKTGDSSTPVETVEKRNDGQGVTEMKEQSSEKEEEDEVEELPVLPESDDESELEEGEIRDTDDEQEAGPSNPKEEKEFTWSADALKPVNRVECNVCGKMFLTEKLLSSHKRWHRQQNHCRECGKTFLWQFELSLHRREQHGVKEEGEGAGSSGGASAEGVAEESDVVEVEGDDSDIEPFIDEESDVDSIEDSTTSGNYDLEDDFTNSEFETTKSETGSVVSEGVECISCKICNKTFRNKTALSMHSSVHTGFSYICTLCGKGYKLDMRYRQHLANAHGLQQAEAEISHTCEYCEKSYKSAIAKREHISSAHPGMKNFKCNICNKSYRSFSKKQKHMIKSHPAWAPFMCQACRSTYNTSKALMQHIQEQHGSTAAQPVMPRKPASQRMLKRYVTEPLPCPPPVKQHVTSVQGTLKIVIKTIKPDPDELPNSNAAPVFKPEPEPVFVPRKSYSVIDCDICNLMFSFKSALKFHLMLVHPSATMHECKRCGMTYTIFKNLQQHKNTHNFVHRCYYCRKSFPRKTALQNHVKTHFPELKGLNLLLKSNRKRRVKVVKTEPLSPWI